MSNDSYTPAFLVLGIACAVAGWGVIAGLIYLYKWIF